MKALFLILSILIYISESKASDTFQVTSNNVNYTIETETRLSAEDKQIIEQSYKDGDAELNLNGETSQFEKSLEDN